MRTAGALAGALLAGAALAVCARAQGEPAEPPTRPAWQGWLANPYYRLSFDARTRMELANFEAFSESSQAYTTRIRAGIGSQPLHGFAGYAEFEGSFSYDHARYWDLVSTNRDDRSPIADPPHADLNQLFLQYERAAWLGLRAKVGRQRITFDDQRFVGNVGWRQNEQVYDAVQGSTSLGLQGLTATYGYLHEVHRIYGDQGGPDTRDFDSDSHLVNVRFEASEAVQATAFAYLLDFRDDAPVFSSNSFGARLLAGRDVGEGWQLAFAGSYARQVDAGRNPVDYAADYVAADASVGYAPLGVLGVGYELLGSDAGRARFVTPLATAHPFNGFADVFTDNGGVDGLQDLYVYLQPELPWKLEARLVYHHFWSDHDGTALGDELDFVVIRAINPYLSVLTKGALFESRSRTRPDGWRYWLEFTVHY